MVDEAVEFIREHEPPDGYFVGFSGGKDSIVTLNLVRQAGVKHHVFFSNTGLEAPELLRFILLHYTDVVWLRPQMSFWKYLRKFSPPFIYTRWCCNKLKKDPSRPAIIKQYIGKELRHRIMGIRAAESIRRASRPRIDTFGGRTLYKPIFGWNEYYVWEFIDSMGLAYPSLYDEGFDRIGCIICPFINHYPAKLKRNRERWPATFRIFENVVTDWFNNYRKSTGQYPEKTAEEYLASYYQGRLSAPGQSEPNLFCSVDWL